MGGELSTTGSYAEPRSAGWRLESFLSQILLLFFFSCFVVVVVCCFVFLLTVGYSLTHCKRVKELFLQLFVWIVLKETIDV